MILLLTGNEPYAISYNKNKYINSIPTEGKEMNLLISSIFDESTIDYCRQYPFLSANRLVVLSLESSSENEQLLDYIKNETNSTTLIILVRELDKKSKLYKYVSKYGKVDVYNKLTDKQLNAFILNIIKKENGAITEDAFNLLKERIGYADNENCNLFNVEIIIKQLLFIQNKITSETIHILLNPSLNESVFKLASYISKKDKLALYLLDELLNDKTPIEILSVLLRSYRLNYKLSFYENRSNAFVQIGISAFQVKDLENIPIEIIKKSMTVIEQSIKDVKHGIPSKQTTKLCVCKLMSYI